MDASHVYAIAKALPKEELSKLYYMLQKEFTPIKIKKDNRRKIDYSISDALNYLLENLP